MLKVKDRKRRVYICFMKTPVTKVKKTLKRLQKIHFCKIIHSKSAKKVENNFLQHFASFLNFCAKICNCCDFAE